MSIWSSPRVAKVLASYAFPVDTGAVGTAASATVSQLDTYLRGNIVNAAKYVTMDGIVLTDVSVTNASPVISSVGRAFVAGDVGKVITIRAAGDAGGTKPLVGYIGSVSSGNASLVTTAGGVTALNAANTSSALTATFGTPDTVGWNLAVSDANSLALLTGASVVIVAPPGVSCIDGTITWQSLVGLMGAGPRSTIIKMAAANTTTAVIQGTSRGATIPYTDCVFRDFGLDLDDTGVVSYSVSAKALYMQYLYRAVFERLYVTGSPASSLGVDYLVDSIISGNVIRNAGRANAGGSAGGAAIGIGTGTAAITCDGVARVESLIVANNSIYNAKRYGIFFENQSATISNGKFVTIGNSIQLSATSLVGMADAGIANGVWIGNHVTGTGLGVGFSIAKGTIGTSLPGSGGISRGNRFDNLANGIVVDYSACTAATAADYSFDDTVSGCTDQGIKVITPSTIGYVISGLDFGRTKVMGGAKCGFNITGTAPVKRLNLGTVTVKNNGTGGVAPRSGVYFAVAADYVWLDAARIYDDQGSPTQAYGLEVNTGAIVTNVLLPSYSFDGNISGSIGGIGTLMGTRVSSVAYP